MRPTLILLFCVLASAARASTYLDTSFGTPVGGTSARSLALGSTGISLHTGSEALFFNPGVLGLEEGNVEVDATIAVSQVTEDRLVPLFDSFQSFVDETIVALNRNTYTGGSAGVLWRLPAEWPMTLGAGVFERFDFDYDYFEEFRDPNSQSSPRDRILQNRELAVEGVLRTISVGYSAEVLRDAHAGLSLHRWTGDVRRDTRVQNFVNSTQAVSSIETDFEGWGFTVGAWGRVDERVALGASFEGSVALDGTRHSVREGAASLPDSIVPGSAAAQVDYPAVLRFGGTYRPRNELRTTFSVEMERRFWEELDRPVVSAFGDTVNARDTWDFRIGLEHIFYNGLPVRFGFRYLENYADPESERSIYSAGVGYRIARFQLDVTGLYHRQASRQEFLFDPSYLTFQAPGSLQKVEDSVLQIVFGVSRTF